MLSYHPTVETFHEISDSLCVAQRKADRMDERVVLFVILREGSELTPDLLKALRNAIRKQLSARHVPSVILPITAIPVSRVWWFDWL